MKKIIRIMILVLFCGVSCLSSSRARAQDESGLSMGIQVMNEPMISDGPTIAMVFGRLTGKEPDFSGWVERTQEYQAATPFEQGAIEKKRVSELRNTYYTLDITAPLVVKTQVKLSAYDTTNHGFFISNFTRFTFFPAQYEGKFYAIVPQGITDKQFLAINDATTVGAIEQAVSNSKDGTLPMVLYLKPVTASLHPVSIGGSQYWPIASDIGKMMLFSGDNQTLLWHNDSSDKNKTNQNLLNLYQ